MNLLDTDWVIHALANRQPALGTLERLAGSRLIAATALHHDLTLLTFNFRHFERIPDLKLYQLR